MFGYGRPSGIKFVGKYATYPMNLPRSQTAGLTRMTREHRMVERTEARKPKGGAPKSEGSISKHSESTMIRRYWLFKSEPEAFSISDLKNSPNGTNYWDGVRNYQARNFLRDQVKVGDGALFYHSGTDPIGIAGEAVVTRAGYPDPTQLDRKSKYYDPKSTQDKPIWYVVDVKFVRACKEIISLRRLERVPGLEKMIVLKRGVRLSIQPVTESEWKAIIKLPEWG